jgi:hypothetical protein
VVFGCYLIAVLVVVTAAARFKPDRLDGLSENHSSIPNWDYRLIFLIPTLPFAFILTRQPEYK